MRPLIAQMMFALSVVNLPGVVIAAETSSPSAAAKAPDPIASTYRPLTGKLFFSDADRARLDKARKSGVQVVDEEALSQTPTLNGVLKSSQGRTTYWVDGTARTAASSRGEVPVASSMVGAEPTVKFRSGDAPASPAPGKAQTNQRKRTPAQK